MSYQVSECMRMYISKKTDGALHLFKEKFNNALDELNKKLPCKENWVDSMIREKFVVSDMVEESH